MSYKVRNIFLANQLALVSVERVQFDADGVGEIQSEELYNELLTLANFFAVGETPSEREARLQAEEQARIENEKEEARLKAEEEARIAAEEEAKKTAEEEATKKASTKSTKSK
jgi:hypothetical protein